MPLTVAQRKALKKKAHVLKPIVMLGQHGLSKEVLSEIDIALNAHELIKIKLAALNPAVRKAQAAAICETLDAEHVMSIGKVTVIFRKAPDL